MLSRQHWAVVLAAGSGTRLESLTRRASGVVTPKQYCSLLGRASLLHLALQRAAAVVPRDRVLIVVAAEHGDWWRSELHDYPPENIIVQPLNRGTAIGTLLPLLEVGRRDPQGRIVFLPADHYVEHERRLILALRVTLGEIGKRTRQIAMLGITPEKPDPELGYIVPATSKRLVAKRVVQFVEKPPVEQASCLIDGGAVWASFIFAGRVAVLNAMFKRHLPRTLETLAHIVRRAPRYQTRLLIEAYRQLESADLSRDVFAHEPNWLRVVEVPPCGWTDLGTPSRVFECVTKMKARVQNMVSPSHRSSAHINLAASLRQSGEFVTSL